MKYDELVRFAKFMKEKNPLNVISRVVTVEDFGEECVYISSEIRPSDIDEFMRLESSR